MLSEGDLIDYDGDALRRVRLVWISDCGTQGAVILVENPRALPELVNVDVLTDDLQSGRARLMLEDPYAVFVADDDLKDSYKAIRDKAWRLIEQLVTCVPDIFVAHRRSRLIKAMVVEIKRKIEASQEENQDAEQSIDHASHVSIYRYIRRYFQRGMTPNALLPDYKRSGGKGKERASSDAKRGRPRKYGTETGINISESIRQAFRVGIQRCYASDKERKWTLRDAYDKVIEWFFSRKCVNDETGKVTVQQRTGQDKTDDPTYDQFLYWVNKDHSRLDIKKSRMGAKLYDKDFRGVIGTSNAEVMGPGDRYQIDATLADVYLVSRFNREWIIGRPVIYVVIDVFSRMIVGLYIGLEGPSWIGAMMALCDALMKFLVRLVNTIGVPVIPIGTLSALPILQGTFSQARRSTGMGSPLWDRMASGDEWNVFLKELWAYQWTYPATAMTPELSAAIYDETQGVADLAVKLFMLAQLRVVSASTVRRHQSEELTIRLFRQVAKEEFALVRPMIDALRSNDPKRLRTFEDLKPLGDHIQSILESSRLGGGAIAVAPVAASEPVSVADQSDLTQTLIDVLGRMGLAPDVATMSLQAAIAENTGGDPLDLLHYLGKALSRHRPSKRRSSKPTPPAVEEMPADDLRRLVADAKESSQRGYDVLRHAGVVRAPMFDVGADPC